MEFRNGDSVEVCSNQEGFLGSYFAARVISRVGKHQYLVEYKTLLTENEKLLLKEIVEASEVRPSPPEIKATDFNLLDQVDAFDNDGWWVGKITGKDDSKYFVYFDSSEEWIGYSASQLRVHQEWVNGTWVPSQTSNGTWVSPQTPKKRSHSDDNDSEQKKPKKISAATSSGKLILRIPTK